MKWRAVISAPYLQPVVTRYQSLFEENDIDIIIPPVRERLSEDELLTCIQNIDGTICGDDRYTETVLKAAKKLKVIVKWGTGMDSIDLAAAERLGIHVYNTPGAFTDAVADSVMGYVLSFARQLPWMDRDIRLGIWRKRPSVALRECVLGVVGIGQIGRAVVRRASAFGMRVLGNDIASIPSSFVTETQIEMVSLDGLLAGSDFVSLNCTLNSTSHHLMGRRELTLMKPSAVLINTSRGPVVDEAALICVLRERRIAGAALDVFEQEPLPSDSPLRSLDTCLLAPHNANGSPAAWDRVHENSIAKLIEGLTMQVPVK